MSRVGQDITPVSSVGHDSYHGRFIIVTTVSIVDHDSTLVGSVRHDR